HLHDPVATDTLRQILVGCPDADFLHALIPGGNLCGGGESVVSFELDHGPDSHPHGRERFFEWVELREKCGLDAFPGLVTRPEVVAEGLDDMIGRHPDVSCPRLDHLQHRMQHADHGAEGWILALVEAAQAVEVAVQFVRAVDEMNDHRGWATTCFYFYRTAVWTYHQGSLCATLALSSFSLASLSALNSYRQY